MGRDDMPAIPARAERRGAPPPSGGRPCVSRCARAFTLIELLVVMAIVAVLLTIAGPRYFDHLDRARETTLRQSLAVMRDAIDKYRADTGSHPRDIDELVARRYLRAVPKDPITESTDTWQIVPPPDAAEAGMWDVKSGARGTARDGTAYADW
jgi:general secretion pathway protein G